MTSHHQTRDLECGLWFPCSCVYWSLVKAIKFVWESQVIDSSSITQLEALWVWRCDVTTSNSIQDGGVLVVNILVFDLLVHLQHCTYQRKTLLFALIKISTFICKREFSGFSSPLWKLWGKIWLNFIIVFDFPHDKYWGIHFTIRLCAGNFYEVMMRKKPTC